jgi:hydroxyethylthiazole kinase-like uncharacterized protein yjeF
MTVPHWSEPLYTAAEMRAAEAAYAGTTAELMERAGAGVAEAALRRFPQARRFAVWCGTGANGGDGFVAARLLREAGREVEVRLLGDEARVRGDAATMLKAAREAGVPFTAEARSADVVVDALFGTGFSGAPRPEAARWIEELNGMGAPVLAVDVPSGVDASTGEAARPAVEAAATVTFHARKVGHVIAPGRFHGGEVEVVDIGLAPEHRVRNLRATERLLELIPRRRPEDNKYTAGAVVVVGGSRGMSGAPSLTAEAAMRAGAGIVTACVPASLSLVFEVRLVEVLKRACADADGHLTEDAADEVVAAAERAHAVALGPGLGRTDGTRALVHTLLDKLDLPVVLDADGLWALAGQLGWVFQRDAPTALTPHAGELGRLLGRDSAWVNAHRLAAASTGADETGAVCLLKGVDTIVAAPGRGVIVSDLGNAGLATAGTGDVLTGTIAALLAKGMEARLAATAGAALGQAASHVAARRHGEAGLIARDVIEALSPTLSEHPAHYR